MQLFTLALNTVKWLRLLMNQRPYEPHKFSIIAHHWVMIVDLDFCQRLDGVLGTLIGEILRTIMVSCQKGPTWHAYAWQIGPFWQDTLELKCVLIPEHSCSHIECIKNIYTCIRCKRDYVTPHLSHMPSCGDIYGAEVIYMEWSKTSTSAIKCFMGLSHICHSGEFPH